MPVGGVPIFIQLCWDGSEVTKSVKTESMWPLTYSIINLPPCLRNKLHIGLHVMALDYGSTAALDKCAEELLDLFTNPIKLNGYNYYVILAQIIMDGQGRCKYCKMQGQRGFAGGCHKCDFKGRAFGRHRTVYDGYRRYTNKVKPRDERRDRKSRRCKSEGLQFSYDEEGTKPTLRTYDEYIRDGLEAERLNDLGVNGKKNNYVNGVMGVWALHVLPYAHLIHWTYDLMHTFSNIIEDCLKSIIPKHGGRTGLLYENDNRTYNKTVVAACRDEKIHRYLHNGEIPPWVLTADDCIAIDRSQMNIIGSFSSEELVRNVMRAHKGARCHDTIYWASVYSRWLLRGRGKVIENILGIFDIMTILNSNRLHVPTIKNVVANELIELLITRSGLVPPSECPITLHELVHVLDQVEEIGAPRYSTLYKFEKLNKLLKQFNYNTAKGHSDNMLKVVLFI